MFCLVHTATMLAAQSIQLGINDIVVAGGMESMSNVPKYFAEARLVFHSSLWGFWCRSILDLFDLIETII